MQRIQQLYLELTRRRVFRALLAWGIFAFAVLQVVEPVLHALEAPAWALKVVVGLLVAGFPATAALSWIFDLTSRGVVRTLPASTALATTVEGPASPRQGSPARHPGAGGPPPPGAAGGEAGDRPDPLSALIRELAQAPGESLLSAWNRELRAGERVGRFRVVREIGRGGFGAVFEAEDSELGRHVALKALRPRRTGEELSAAWIEKEAEAIARLDHPCIVTLFDVGNADAGPYLVMELLHGETLAQRLARGPLALGDALHVAKQMARGLAHAHARGILHRDLKPANVFLCDDGRVKLLDFGLAHLLGASGASGSGTPGYMAPEQARGDAIDARADVYAAAMTLRESLAGTREPGAEASLPAPARRLIEKALSPDRERRPRDGTAWLEQIAAARRAIERPRKVARVAALALGVVAVAAGVAFAAWRHGRVGAPGDTGDGPSVAVLPFVDLSPGRDQEYLADGLAEEILNALSHVEGLRVIGRTSSFSFKGKDVPVQEIGRRLNVRSILTGSVRREGDQLRVTAQLVDAAGGHNAWSESYGRRMESILEVQDDIGQAVVRALASRLATASGASGGGRTGSPASHDYYLQGLHHGAKQELDGARRARAALEKAIALDPGNARAHAALSRAIFQEYNLGDGWTLAEDDAFRRQAMAAAERAVEVGPDVAEGYAARGFLRLTRFDWTGGRADIDRALELAPNDPGILRSGCQLRTVLARLKEAIALGKRAVELDPLSGGWHDLGRAYLYDGQLSLAAFAIDRMIELRPGNPYNWGLRIQVHLLQHQPEAALAAARAISESRHAMRLQGIALAEHDLGHRAESDRALAELSSLWRDGYQYQIAQVHAWRGEPDLAFEWLERAYAERDPATTFVRSDPALRSLHGDPRFVALVRKMDFPAVP